MNRIWMIVTDWTPRRCATCRRWCWQRDLHPARHTLAGWLLICTTCYHQLYGDE